MKILSKIGSMNKTRWIILLLGVLFVITFIVGYQVGEMRSEPTITSDTVTVVEFDTIFKDTTIIKTKYIPKKVEVIRTDTITKDTILNFEKKIYNDTLCNDKDSIILQSFIFGINSKLDSTSVVWKKHKEIVTNTVEITKYIEKPKKLLDRIHFQPQVGVGYGVMSKNIDMYVGVGVGIDIGGK